jgi:RNA polymerase sigma-70 factor (ECF subfamily)
LGTRGRRCCREEYDAWVAARAARNAPAELAANEGMAQCLRAETMAFAGRCATHLTATDAEDLFQEAWGRLQRALERFQGEPGPCFPLALLLTILRNLAIDHVRRKARRPVVEGNAEEWHPDEDAPVPAEEAVRQEARELVHRVLERMASSKRAADRVGADLLVRHYLHGQSAPQIALTLGKTTDSVEQALRRARIRFIEANVQERGSGEIDE